MESIITNSNLLVIQLLSLIDTGYKVEVEQMAAQVNKLGLDKYLIEACNTKLTVDNIEYFDIVTKNLINFWNVNDNEDVGIKNNGLVYLVFSLLELNRMGYRDDL